MTQGISRLVRTLLAALLASALGGCVLVQDDTTGQRVPVGAGTPTLTGGKGTAGVGTMSRAELQTEVLLFADRFLEGVAEASDRAALISPNASAAAIFHQTKTVYATSAVALAVLPHPDHALREFVALLTLARSVWESDAVAWAAPQARELMTRELAHLDEDLERLAARVLPRESIDAVRILARRWRAANPDRTYVAFVRLSELDDEDSALMSQAQARGLFAPITEATRQLEELRAIAERSLFIANRFTLLANWQGQSLVDSILERPAVTGALADVSRVSALAERSDAVLLDLIETVAIEREAAIEHLAETIARERSVAIAEVFERISAEREALAAQLEGSSSELLPLAQAIVATSTNLRETIAMISELRSGDAAEPLDIAELQVLAGSVRDLSAELNVLVAATHELLASDESAAGLARVEGLLRGLELRLLGIGALLIVLAGVVALIVVVLARRSETAV